MAEIKQHVEVYKTLEDFVEDLSRSGSQNVTLDNIQNLFLYFGSFLVLTLLVFLMNSLLFKQLQTINSKLVRCSVMREPRNQFSEHHFLIRFSKSFANTWRTRLAKGLQRVLGILKLVKAN